MRWRWRNLACRLAKHLPAGVNGRPQGFTKTGLGPGIGGVAVTAHFPEAELVFGAELDPANELGAFPGVEFRDDDAGRAAMLAWERLAVVDGWRSGRHRP